MQPINGKSWFRMFKVFLVLSIVCWPVATTELAFDENMLWPGMLLNDGASGTLKLGGSFSTGVEI